MNLITGGTGFLGAHLAASLLKNGKNVGILKRPFSSSKELKIIFLFHFGECYMDYYQQISFFEGDITDPSSLEEVIPLVDTVYHCAAVVSFDKKDSRLLQNSNVEGTANLVNVMLKYPHKKLCYVSSIGALGRSENGEAIDENTMWVNTGMNTMYSRSKYLAELEVWRGIAEGINCVIVNPGIIIGPGDWNKGTCKLFPLVQKGMKYYTQGINGYVDVRDVAETMVLLTESSLHSERYILISENLSYRDLLNGIAEKLDKPLPHICAGYNMRKFLVIADAMKSLLTGSQRQYSDQFPVLAGSKSEYSSFKIKSALGVRFRSMTETLSDTCTYYLLSQHK